METKNELLTNKNDSINKIKAKIIFLKCHKKVFSFTKIANEKILRF